MRVLVIKKSDELMGQIPPMIEGYPVDVQETGEFRPLVPSDNFPANTSAAPVIEPRSVIARK